MNREAIEARIKGMIVSLLELEKDPGEIASDENLIEGIGLNSVDALELLLMIEEEFEIEIDDDDLNEELVATVATMAEYVTRSRGET